MTAAKKVKHRPLAMRILSGIGLVLGGLVALIVLVFAGLWLYAGGDKTPPSQIAWGVTWSAPAAHALGLDPHEAYLALLNETHPQRLRLSAYWNETEPTNGKFNFSELDFQVRQAESHNIPYIIAVGRRVPRYPECFTPSWAAGMAPSSQQERLLHFENAVMRRYDHQPHLYTWQVENEPYLGSFGICPKLNIPYLQQEVALARSLTAKPIMMTDSGELSVWYNATKLPDAFGSTMYRVVVDGKTGKVFHHFLPPWAYTRRANLVKKIHPNVKKVIVAELQAEPWANRPLIGLSQDFYYKTMGHDQFDTNVNFATDTGMPEVYLWGAEWWYYEKLHGDPYYWQAVTKVFAHTN